MPDKWITVKPNGAANKGRPALIGPGGEVKGGMGGKFNGQKISQIKGGSKEANPAPQKVPQQEPKPSSPHDVSKVDMSPREVEAMKNYSGAMFRDLNARLRKGKGPAREDAADLKQMDKVFERASAKEPMTLFRGVGKDVVSSLKVGGTFEDKGFQSATTSRDTAERYAQFGGSGGATLEIRVPKGGKAVSLKDISSFGGKTSSTRSEEEILLNRGGKYKVVDIIQDKPRWVKGGTGTARKITPPPRIVVEMEHQKEAHDHKIGIAIAADSVRHKDDNGFLHVAASHISKETVNPYYGREIPDWEERGLDPEKIYYGYRSGEELEKGAATFNGLPLLRGHHVEHAESPQKEHRVGSLGTDAVWDAPYLDNSLIITDGEAIRKIESGERVELSAAYAYDPDFTAGEFDGKPYDFVMTNIRGNHVALVEEGRAGPDVIVADEMPKGVIQTMYKQLKSAIQSARRVILGMDENPNLEGVESALENALLEIQQVEGSEGIGEDEDKDAKIKEILEFIPDLAPEQVEQLSSMLNDLAYSQATGDEGLDPDDGTTGDAEAAPTAPDNGGMKQAMDACGLDAENPEFQKAFAEGVKYGERKEKEEPKKLDREHESEGAKKAMDANPFTSARVVSHLKAMQDAVTECRPLVGDIDMFAFDSADGIYLNACRLLGQPSVSKASARAVVLALKSQMFPTVAQDSAHKGYAPRFK